MQEGNSLHKGYGTESVNKLAVNTAGMAQIVGILPARLGSVTINLKPKIQLYVIFSDSMIVTSRIER
jgi:hypothetical protein